MEPGEDKVVRIITEGIGLTSIVVLGPSIGFWFCAGDGFTKFVEVTIIGINRLSAIGSSGAALGKDPTRRAEAGGDMLSVGTGGICATTSRGGIPVIVSTVRIDIATSRIITR